MKMGIKLNIKTKILNYIKKNSNYEEGCEKQKLINKYSCTLFPLKKLDNILIDFEKTGLIIYDEKLNSYRCI